MACQPSPSDLMTTPGFPGAKVIRVSSGRGRQEVSRQNACPGVGQLPKAVAYVLSVGNFDTDFWQDEWDSLFIQDEDGVNIILA